MEIVSYINPDKFKNLQIEKSCLYIVSTPIGNLEDISFRALFVLNNVDLILCEDTRTTSILLSKYQIKNKLTSYYSRNELIRLDEIIDKISDGLSVALVSDSGTPCISDPGGLLVSECIEKGIKIYSIPGSSAIIHSLVLSGFKIKNFYFQGFLPQKKGREKTLSEISKINSLIVIYESPYRILKLLTEVAKHFGNKEIAIGRELTKMFEQFIRGRVLDVIKKSTSMKIKGEFVLIINNR
ncbi:MAG TPA: 16S rRNA (cytidine(1402)-2'-O)-methyltransferase [Ignavibacteria bacterium]|nr:16S rRNA (cytidine(1402)-2'-O)-methyltransferase [Ignavibacteria bacterium]